jgi:hypothetical protein
MRTLVAFSILIFSGLFFSSCEDVVQIELDEGSKLYVVDAFVNDLRQDQVIKITTNDSYFSNREAPPVPHANVVLKDLTDNKQYTFGYTSNGNYVYKITDPDTISKIGHQYELNVSIDGITYTSLATQKRTAGIDSIGTELFNGDTGFGFTVTPYYMCTLYAKDKVDENADYYWIKTFRNDTLFMGPSDVNVTIDGVGGPVTQFPLDSVEFTPPATFLSFKQYNPGSTCKVEIHSISRENYYFFIQAVQQINNAGLFATTPENVKTNIVTPSEAKTKAIGRFNMASVTSKKITIP